MIHSMQAVLQMHAVHCPYSHHLMHEFMAKEMPCKRACKHVALPSPHHTYLVLHSVVKLVCNDLRESTTWQSRGRHCGTSSTSSSTKLPTALLSSMPAQQHGVTRVPPTESYNFGQITATSFSACLNGVHELQPENHPNCLAEQ